MREADPAFSHHDHEVSITELEAQIPADTEDDDLPIEMPAFKKIVHAQHFRWRSNWQSAYLKRTSNRLHQSLFDHLPLGGIAIKTTSKTPFKTSC
jgi:hypothetical protein